MKLTLPVLLACFFSLQLFSQSMAKKYAPKKLHEDYSMFCSVLESVHTGLYDYISQDDWNQLKDSIYQHINKSMTERAFSNLLAYQVGLIRNTHTRLGVTNSWYEKKSNIFPFTVKYIDGRLYINKSTGGDLVLPKGTEILAINDKTPTQIKESIWPYISTDGFIQTYKWATLSEFFSWFYALMIGEPDFFQIKYLAPGVNIRTSTTPALRKSFQQVTREWRYQNDEKVTPFNLEIDPALNTAYLKIHRSESIEDSLNTYFESMLQTGVTNLIIDLRGMWGLTEEIHATQLYSYLVDQPFQFYERIEVKSNDYKLFDKHFTYKPYANSLEEIKTEFFDKLLDSGQGYFIWECEPYMGVLQPAGVHYKGKIYILVDGLNYSASTDFTSKASTLENVYVVGEETGGEYRTYVSGAMFGLTLPHSNLILRIATWKSVLNVEEIPGQKGRGVVPDFPIRQSLSDFIENRDTVKEFVYELIGNSE